MLCKGLGAAGTHEHPYGNAPPFSHRPSTGLPRCRFLSQRPATNWDSFLHINKPIIDSLRPVPPDGSGAHLLPTMLPNCYGHGQPAQETQKRSHRCSLESFILRHDLLVHLWATAVSGPPLLPSPPPPGKTRREEHEGHVSHQVPGPMLRDTEGPERGCEKNLVR